MSRASDGTYSRVSNSFSNPVVGAILSPTDADALFDDIESELTDSYSRSIKGGMLVNGTALLPAFTWSSDLNTGIYRIGADNLGIAVGGAKVIDVAAAGVSITGTLAVSGAVAFKDTLFTLQDDGDTSKQLAFQLSGLTTATTRTLTLQDVSGTIALTSNKLSAFAATTSAELAGIISDETGSGSLVFASTPTLVTPVLGAATGTSLTLSSFIDITEIASPASPASDHLRLFAKDVTGATHLFTRDSAGTEVDITAAGGGGAAAATQAEQETGSSTSVFVSPGRQQFHPSAVKFWGFVTYTTGTPTLQTNYNITSITDTAVGKLTVTIATDFSSANWAGFVVSETATNDDAFDYNINRAAGSVEFRHTESSGTFADPANIGFGGLGDQ